MCVNESIENGDFAKYLPQQYDDLMRQVVQDEISATITHTHIMKYAVILYDNKMNFGTGYED